jgi:hypothetical protein
VEGALAYLEQQHGETGGDRETDVRCLSGSSTLLLANLLGKHLSGAGCAAAAAQPAADVNGTWRLVFSTATSSRFMQYIPVQVSRACACARAGQQDSRTAGGTH